MLCSRNLLSAKRQKIRSIEKENGRKKIKLIAQSYFRSSIELSSFFGSLHPSRVRPCPLSITSKSKVAIFPIDSFAFAASSVNLGGAP